MMLTKERPKKAANRATAPRVTVSGKSATSDLAALIADTNATMATLSDKGRTNVRRHMETKGYRETTVSEFLGLTPEDEAAIEARLSTEKRDS